MFTIQDTPAGGWNSTIRPRFRRHLAILPVMDGASHSRSDIRVSFILSRGFRYSDGVSPGDSGDSCKRELKLRINVNVVVPAPFRFRGEYIGLRWCVIHHHCDVIKSEGVNLYLVAFHVSFVSSGAQCHRLRPRYTNRQVNVKGRSELFSQA